MLDIPVYEAVQAVGGMVPGEIRMAITLQLLAGKIFAECIGWVLETFHFPLPTHL
jgi:hypothetical protein